MDRDLMSGLAKGLRIIESFTADRHRLSIAEVAAISGYDRATTRRCLLTLKELGYCTHDGKYFTPTPRILRLGVGCLASLPLPKVVQPVLDRISETIGQSTSVSILDDSEIVYIARSSQKRVMSIALMPGSRLPAYCTSMGRVLLSSRSREEVSALLARTAITERTDRTETCISVLEAIVDDVRARGFSANDQEVEIGLRSVAVPLFNQRKEIIAAINVGLAASEEPMDSIIDRYLPVLLEAQKDIISNYHLSILRIR